MSKCFAGRFGAGAMPMIVAVFVMIAPVIAEASVSAPDQDAIANRSLMMCAALYGPRRDLHENRCDSLTEVPRGSPGRMDESVSDETLGDWPVGASITVSQTDMTKEVLE